MFRKEAEDVTLMKKVAKGDKEAFRQLALVYRRPLYNFCLKMMSGAEPYAEDVLQQALITWWQKAPLWQKEKGTLKAWVFTIAANKCRDYLRTHKIHVELDDAFEAVDDLMEDVHSNEQRKALLGAMERLNVKQKQIVWMVYFEDMKQTDVAFKLNMNLKAVESALGRARGKMKDALEHKKGDLL